MERKQRLLIVGPLPPPFSGPEIGVQTLVLSPELNHRYEVRSLNTTLRTSNVEKGRLDLVMLAAYPRYVWRLLRELLGSRPDAVLYCPTSATLKGWVRDGTTCLVCRALSRPLFVQFRGGHFRLFYDRQWRPVRAVIGWLLRGCRRVIVQAERLRGQFDPIVGAERVRRLPNALSDEFFDSFDDAISIRSRRRDSGRATRVLFVGHLSHAKGYCDLLKVIPGLCERHDVVFDFIGAPSPERNVFFNQVTGEPIDFDDPVEVFRTEIEERGLEGRVFFHGDRVLGEEKVERFVEADVFVLPSYSEGFSMALLEAMGAGLPVVATPVGAAPEIVSEGESGHLVDPGRLGELERALDRLLGDFEARLRLGTANRRRCAESYRTEHTAAALISIVDEELEPHSLDALP